MSRILKMCQCGQKPAGRFRPAALLMTAVLSVLILTALTPAAFADSTLPEGYQDSAPDDYITQDFKVNVKVDADHTCHFTEKISVDFIKAHHGIYRYIPSVSKYYVVKHVKADGGDVDLSSQRESGANGEQINYTVVRIGDEDKTITGKKTYTIKYDLVCYKDDSKKEDSLALNVLPTSWDTSIRHASASVTLPKTIPENKLKFYGGKYGSRESGAGVFTTKVSDGGKKIAVSGDGLDKGVGFTIRAQLPEGYWVNPPTHDFALKLMIFLLIFIPLLLALMWHKFGRDPQIVQPVEFYAPEGMTPAEVGYVVDGSADRKDLTSLLIYFASKGYLKITEKKRGKFEITRLQEIDQSEKKFVKTFFKGLFKKKDSVMLDDLPVSFADTVESAKDQLTDYYKQPENRIYTASSVAARGFSLILMLVPPFFGMALAGYYAFDSTLGAAIFDTILMLIGMMMVIRQFDRARSNTVRRRTVLLVIGFILFSLGLFIAVSVTASVVGRLFPAILLGVSTLISFFFTVFMKARTEENAGLVGRVLGFRNFIRNAEYDRLKVLSDEDPEYFFNVMPYAFVMGLSTRWVERFSDIKIQKPVWYDTYRYDGRMFNAFWMTRMMTGTSAAIDKSVSDAIKADSGGGFSGGFSGGGFSGGGFGGGGGGAW